MVATSAGAVRVAARAGTGALLSLRLRACAAAGRLSVSSPLPSVRSASAARAWEGDSPRSCAERRRSSHRSPAW